MLFTFAVLPLIASLAGSALAAPHRMDASLMARRGFNAGPIVARDNSTTTSIDNSTATATSAASTATNVTTNSTSVDNSTATATTDSAASTATDVTNSTSVDNSTVTATTDSAASTATDITNSTSVDNSTVTATTDSAASTATDVVSNSTSIDNFTTTATTDSAASTATDVASNSTSVDNSTATTTTDSAASTATDVSSNSTSVDNSTATTTVDSGTTTATDIATSTLSVANSTATTTSNCHQGGHLGGAGAGHLLGQAGGHGACHGTGMGGHAMGGQARPLHVIQCSTIKIKLRANWGGIGSGTILPHHGQHFAPPMVMIPHNLSAQAPAVQQTSVANYNPQSSSNMNGSVPWIVNAPNPAYGTAAAHGGLDRNPTANPGFSYAAAARTSMPPPHIPTPAWAREGTRTLAPDGTYHRVWVDVNNVGRPLGTVSRPEETAVYARSCNFNSSNFVWVVQSMDMAPRKGVLTTHDSKVDKNRVKLAAATRKQSQS
ncbi:hypothetical protein C8R44DRAFT_724395 [Mycena epipterygia]|nr:hypothetical protein C8R44DRAFT_724395 [Mycena epipterygia]